MRANVVAAIGGLIIGHVLWLVGISLAIDTTSISSWVLVVSGVVLVGTVVAVILGWRFEQRQAYAKAWFAWCLPVAPVLLSVIVLGVTYL